MAESKSKSAKEQKALAVQSAPDIAQGRFATNVGISLADEYAVLTFLATDPEMTDQDGEQVAMMVSRIFLTIPHAQRLADALSRLLAEQVAKTAKKPSGSGK